MLAFCLALLEDGEDQALFLEFHARHEKKLYAVALNILKSPALAEEAVQNAVLQVTTHFEQYKKIYQKNCNEIGPWSVTIVKNLALNTLRKECRSGPLDENWDAAAPEDTEGESGYRRLVALIRAMPPAYREALELKFVLEWSNREIAKALGISESAVAGRILRGRAILIERLKEEGYERERIE